MVVLLSLKVERYRDSKIRSSHLKLPLVSVTAALFSIIHCLKTSERLNQLWSLGGKPTACLSHRVLSLQS